MIPQVWVANPNFVDRSQQFYNVVHQETFDAKYNLLHEDISENKTGGIVQNRNISKHSSVLQITFYSVQYSIVLYT